MKQTNLLKYTIALCLSFGLSMTWAQVTTFDYTGGMQTYTVPPGVSSIQFECYGAEGETGAGAEGGVAGLGGLAQGNLAVLPGEVYNIFVGGQAGYNGGGDGGEIAAGNGGGASDVRFGGVGLGDRIIVGGGGGGGGSTGCNADHAGGIGGAGGGDPGTKGADSPNGGGGFQGTSGTGGAAGIGCAGFLGGPGLDDGTGGNGQGCCCPTTPGGGGGGGGFIVGGGGGGGSAGTTGCSGNDKGGGGGGAGGTSFTGALLMTLTNNGIRTSNGQIIITELCMALTVTVSDDVICLGDSFTLDATGEGTITWDGGVVNGEPFAPVLAGVITYTTTSDDDADCDFSVDIEVIELPVVTASTDAETICYGETVILTGGGADSYVWSPVEITDGEAYSPEVGEYTYIVTGTDGATDCENTAEVDVTVYELPDVIATATDDEICLGESVTLNGVGATTYVWAPSEDDGVEFTPTETGETVYTVVGTDGNDCSNNAIITITVYDALEITYSTVEEISGADGEIDITVTGGNPSYTFDWDNDGTGDFDDTEDLVGLVGGTYIVVAMCEAGCTITETIVLSSQVSIEELKGINVTVYPNPTSNNITIVYDGQFNYELTSIAGGLITFGSALNSEELSLENLSKGVYILNINSSEGKSEIRIIKE